MLVKYDLLSETPPPFPSQLPNLVKKAIAPVPDVMKPAAANALFAPIAALMHDVSFVYVDNVGHEPTVMEIVVAASGLGKGYLDPMKDALAAPLRTHDTESRRKMEQYNEEYKKKSANQSKPERPKDAAILCPEPDRAIRPSFSCSSMPNVRVTARSIAISPSSICSAILVDRIVRFRS